MILRKSPTVGLVFGGCLVSVGILAMIAGRSSGDEPHLDGAQGPPANRLKPMLPAPSQTANVVPLSAAEQLGKDIFFDASLSHPAGYSCASCHVPATGFTSPSSLVNELSGPVPGVVPGRFGFRKPQAVAYSTFSPVGPYYDDDLEVWLGGNFWDGRAPDNASQARMPFLGPNEMANAATGPIPPHAGGYSAMVAQKIRKRPYAALLAKVFGKKTLAAATDEDLYHMTTMAIGAWEASAEVNPFSSKYDASQYGVLASKKYKLTASEANGMSLFFGKAQCSACHSSATLEPVLAATGGKDTFTMYCYANIGVPRNPKNPFYNVHNGATNPSGFNPQGAEFVDFGIGANPNSRLDGGVFFNQGAGDIPTFAGLFKAPSVRNVDKRPSPGFVKAYMHNGVFKNLEQVVHFYNKRNIAADAAGHEVAFDLRTGPPAGFAPLFAPPEVLENVQNASGVSPEGAADDDDVAINGQVGNLGLTAKEEADVVNFLKVLTDGYTRPNPAPKP